MTNEDLADRIMFRIEREGAIHKSSIVQELELAQRPIVARSSWADVLGKSIVPPGEIEAMLCHDGYPVEGSK
jgi:hypothetical protein